MARITARDTAFKLIYESFFDGRGDIGAIASSMEVKLNDDDIEYINRVFPPCSEGYELDAIIEKYLKGWTIDRLAKIDLSILRLAVYEILYCEDIPHSVSANEAVALAEKYSTDEAPAFVNGVLGSVIQEADKK